MPSTQVICSILIIFLIGHINICFSESFNKIVELSQDEKSLTDGSSGDILASSSSRITSSVNPSRSIKANISESDHYERPSSEEDEEEHDPPYKDSRENEIETENEINAINEMEEEQEIDAENEIDEENETLEKSETFNDPEVIALASTLTKRWQQAFHRTRKAIFGAPRYIIVRYHKTFGNFLGLKKHKKEKKKKHKKKKHHHHHHSTSHSHESDEE